MPSTKKLLAVMALATALTTGLSGAGVAVVPRAQAATFCELSLKAALKMQSYSPATRKSTIKALKRAAKVAPTPEVQKALQTMAAFVKPFTRRGPHVSFTKFDAASTTFTDYVTANCAPA